MCASSSDFCLVLSKIDLLSVNLILILVVNLNDFVTALSYKWPSWIVIDLLLSLILSSLFSSWLHCLVYLMIQLLVCSFIRFHCQSELLLVTSVVHFLTSIFFDLISLSILLYHLDERSDTVLHRLAQCLSHWSLCHLSFWLVSSQLLNRSCCVVQCLLVSDMALLPVELGYSEVPWVPVLLV